MRREHVGLKVELHQRDSKHLLKYWAHGLELSLSGHLVMEDGVCVRERWYIIQVIHVGLCMFVLVVCSVVCLPSLMASLRGCLGLCGITHAIPWMFWRYARLLTTVITFIISTIFCMAAHVTLVRCTCTHLYIIKSHLSVFKKRALSWLFLKKCPL